VGDSHSANWAGIAALDAFLVQRLRGTHDPNALDAGRAARLHQIGLPS
jgi:hypothetical protein